MAVGPQPADDAVERRTWANLVLDDLPVRERQPQDRGVRVRPGAHLDHVGHEQLVDEPVRVVDDEEAPILERRRAR